MTPKCLTVSPSGLERLVRDFLSALSSPGDDRAETAL
jgi:hypothetical protein